MQTQLSISKEVCKALFLPQVDEQELAEAIGSSRNGIYIGRTRRYSLPFFLDFERLVNPHVFITGITGSGKTFLARSLMLRMHATLECSVIVIDFTGEYSEFSSAFAAPFDPRSISRAMDGVENALLYMNLKGYPEGERIRRAILVLRGIVARMRRRGYGEGVKRTFVVLDEAWKLVGRGRELEILIREGRKYKVGVVIASQLIEDIDAPFLGNIASVFVFRVQNKATLQLLARNYNLRDEHLDAIQNLGVGSCLAIQLDKSEYRYAFEIGRVAGVGVNSVIRILFGDSTAIEIGMRDFEEMARRLCGDDCRELVIRAKEHGSIRLDALIAGLLEKGADRRKALLELRQAGIGDDEIADGFAEAIRRMGADGDGE